MAGTPIAIIMGSQSDWATMRHAAETLDALGIAYDARIVSAHRTPDRLYAFAKERQGGGLPGDHRRRRRRGPPARHDRRHDAPARLRRAGGIQGAVGPGQPALHRADAGRHSRSARSPSAGPAPSTRRFSPPPSSPCTIRRWPSASTRGASARATAWPSGPPTKADHPMIRPGCTLGILGGGQLGRMLAMAAAQLGLKTHIYAPEAEQPGLRGGDRDHHRGLRGRGEPGALRQGGRRRHLRVRERAERDRRDP